MNKQINVYTAFGLMIESDIDLPELFSITKENDVQADVKIGFGQVPEKLENPLKQNPWYEVSANEFLLRVEGIANYYLKNGEEIIIEAKEAASEDDIHVFLLNAVFSQLLYQKGYFVLHGSSFEINGKGVILLGHSGVGKTAMALMLHEKGYQLLGDEICAIKIEEGTPILIPGIPQLAVWKDTLVKLGMDPTRYKTIRKGINKFAFDVKDQFYNKEIELSTIVVLEKHNKDGILQQSVNGVAKFDKIMGYLYNENMSEVGARIRDTFSKSVTIANSCKLNKITYQDLFHESNALVDMITKELEVYA